MSQNVQSYIMPTYGKRDLEFIRGEGCYLFTNQNEKYLRIRIRKIRQLLFQQGLDTNKVIRTIENLKQSKEALDFYVNKAKKNIILILVLTCSMSHPLH